MDLPIFNALELLKCPTMYDISEKMNFDIPFMIWRKNFEIRIVLSGELPSSKGYYRTLSSVQNSVYCFITQLQKGIFNALELLKCPTMWDITENMNFDISFMIWRKNFEIRIILLRELPSCKDYLSLLSYFELSPRFSSRLYNSTAKGYFFNALELLKCPTM